MIGITHRAHCIMASDLVSGDLVSGDIAQRICRVSIAASNAMVEVGQKKDRFGIIEVTEKRQGQSSVNDAQPSPSFRAGAVVRREVGGVVSLPIRVSSCYCRRVCGRFLNSFYRNR